MPWLDAMPQHAALGQAKEGVQQGAQSQSNDPAENFKFLSGLIRKFLPSDLKDKDVEIMLNVFQNRKACDTIFVCHLMSHVWGEFQEDDIARIIQARDVCKFGDDDYRLPFQISMIVTFMETARSDELGGKVKEIFGAKSQWKMWLKVRERYTRRGKKRDQRDTAENTAWKIWSEAQAELEKLKEVDKMSVEADDDKRISRDGRHSRSGTTL